jgi:hypothetical protein
MTFETHSTPEEGQIACLTKHLEILSTPTEGYPVCLTRHLIYMTNL